MRAQLRIFGAAALAAVLVACTAKQPATTPSPAPKLSFGQSHFESTEAGDYVRITQAQAISAKYVDTGVSQKTHEIVAPPHNVADHERNFPAWHHNTMLHKYAFNQTDIFMLWVSHASPPAVGMVEAYELRLPLGREERTFFCTGPLVKKGEDIHAFAESTGPMVFELDSIPVGGYKLVKQPNGIDTFCTRKV